MAKYHDFYVSIGFYEKNDQQLELYCKSSTLVILIAPSKPEEALPKRKRGKYSYISLLVEVLMRKQKRLA